MFFRLLMMMKVMTNVMVAGIRHTCAAWRRSSAALAASARASSAASFCARSLSAASFWARALRGGKGRAGGGKGQGR